MLDPNPQKKCSCAVCCSWTGNNYTFACPDCGRKTGCPKAAHHIFACSSPNNQTKTMKSTHKPLTAPENEAKASVDYVNAPPHYQQGSIEAIDAIRSQLTPEEFRGYLKGTIAKYVWRERHKGGTQDLEKAAWYIERLVRADRGA